MEFAVNATLDPSIIGEVLPKQFYLQDTIDVARGLLGKVLVRQLPNGELVGGVIVETEAYLGAEDPACHSFNYRRTPRTSTMFLAGGHSYVYFIYGMYFCFNVVTAAEGEPEAVLIRALEPCLGIKTMQIHRPHPLKNLTNGPGKLCQALAIDKSLNGLSLAQSPIHITEGLKLSDSQIESSARIGIGNSHDAVHWPLRYSVSDNPYVSV